MKMEVDGCTRNRPEDGRLTLLTCEISNRR